MAPRLITSEPRPSIRHPKWHYCYYNQKTAAGRDCVVVIPNSLIGVVRRGFAFDDETDLHWDDNLKATVLSVDFDAPASEHPSQPPNRDIGWADPDTADSIGTADPAALRQFAAAQGLIPEPPTLDPALETILEQLCLAYSYASKRLGCNERPRAMEIQKLLVTAAIPWIKATGVKLSDDEERAMSF